jgi:hypothetical protein
MEKRKLFRVMVAERGVPAMYRLLFLSDPNPGVEANLIADPAGFYKLVRIPDPHLEHRQQDLLKRGLWSQ